MDITDYTTYNEIRSSVGLASKELTDVELAQEIYANRLDLNMGKIDLTETGFTGTLKANFATIAAKAEIDRTSDEQELYNLTRLFSTYTVAYEVAVSLSMHAKSLTDSKASLTRFSSESSYKLVKEALKNQISDIKDQIENIGVDTTTSLTYLSVITPDTDVVTDE
jgi:hypothetical protein